MLFQFVNENWQQPLGNLDYMILLLIFYLIFLLIITIFLKIALGMVDNAKHTEFGNVFITSLVITIIWLLLGIFLLPLTAFIVGLILMWIIISIRHDTGFATAIGVTVIALILYIIVIILLGILFHITIVQLPF